MNPIEHIESLVDMHVQAFTVPCDACDGLGVAPAYEKTTRVEIEGVPHLACPFKDCTMCGGTGSKGPSDEERLSVTIAVSVGVMLSARAAERFDDVDTVLMWIAAKAATLADPQAYVEQLAAGLERRRQADDEAIAAFDRAVDHAREDERPKGALTPEELAELEDDRAADLPLGKGEGR